MNDQPTPALDSLKVLDFTQMMTGPLATMVLADFGADVIKVEAPGGDPFRRSGETTLAGDGVFFLSMNRNKRGIVVDMKTPEGQKKVQELAAEADVVIENFRPGLAEKLGIDYERLKQDNPRLIYCSITGFGRKGRNANRPALDQVIQAMSGMMQVTGTPESGPQKVGSPIADFTTAMLATIGILTALYKRTFTGRGQRLDISMMDAAIFSMAPRDLYFQATKKAPPLTGNAHWDIVPTNTYKTSDGREIMIITINDKFWLVLAKALGLEFMVTDPRFATKEARLENRTEVDRLLSEAFSNRTLEEWDDILTKAGAIYGPVRTWDEVYADPDITENLLEEIDHPTGTRLRYVGNPIKLAETPPNIRTAPPSLGQHNEEILNRPEKGWPARKD